MPRNISFAMTTPQFIDRSKTVTRRWGWHFLVDAIASQDPRQENIILQGVEKAMGIKKGEKMKRLGLIEVVDARFEPLDAMVRDLEYGETEMRLEGFPFGMTNPVEFVERLAKEGKRSPSSLITRIEFKHIEGDLL